MSDPTTKDFVSYDQSQQKGFYGFTSKTKSFQTVLDNIQRLEKELPQMPDSYRKQIIQRFFDDIAQRSQREIRFQLFPNVLEEMSKLSYDLYPRYIFYRYRYEVFPKSREIDDFPPYLQIEPTSICNFRCVFCFQTDKEFSKDDSSHMGMMDFELFKKVVDEAEGKCEAITIASRGEPLMCKDIGKMLRYMKGKFLAAKLNTNASLLTEDKAHDILSSDLQTVVFSVDAADEPLYGKLRVNGQLEETYKNIERFARIKKEHYPNSQTITRISGVKINDKQKLDRMQEVWGNFVDQIAFVNFVPWKSVYTSKVNDITNPCSEFWMRPLSIGMDV